MPFKDFPDNLQISLAVADSSTALVYLTRVLLLVSGFHKLLLIPQVVMPISQSLLRFSLNCLFLERF